jgi:hypothetical protein
MGKRTGQLAGLAALGALGYMLSKDSKGGKNEAPVETRSFSPNPAPRSMPAAERSAPMPRAMDSGDDRDVGGGFNPAGLRRNMETGEMYDPGTVTNRAVESPVNRSTVTPAALTPRAPAKVAAPASSAASRPASAPAASDANTYTRRMGAQAGEAEAYRASQAARSAAPAASAASARTDVNSNVTVAPERGSFRGPSAAQLREYEASRNASRASAPAASSASAPASAASKSARPASAATRPASAASKAAPEQKSGLTLGTPTRPAPGAPSIYAGKEAWAEYRKRQAAGMKNGGAVKKMASGGMTSSASKRGDGIAQRGKTRGKMV